MKEMFSLFSLFLLFCSFGLYEEQSCDSLLVSDFSPQDCVNKQEGDTTYYYWINEGECLPSCKEYTPDGPGRTNCPCPPAYACDHRCSGTVANSLIVCETNNDCPVRSNCVEMCVADQDSCMAYHAFTSDFMYNKYTAQKFKPSCNVDGLWNAKQCKGGVSGRCFCFDGKGNRLFGQAKYSESKDMTCACSRRKADLESSGRPYVSFHCDGMGNFEKLQCDSGSCWCVEPKTGELASPVVPERAMIKLPCYSASEVGGQYLRQCDSAKYGMSKILTTLKAHGVKYASLGNLLCDGDGAYGIYNISAGIAYCTWRDGTKIGTWQSDTSTDVSTLNCNCARDFKMYNHILDCDGSGNYKPLQSVVEEGSTIYYCIDSDGFAKSDVSKTRIDDCNIYY